MSDMKTVTMRDLNRRTAGILDAVEDGEIFELRRNGKVVAYLSNKPPELDKRPGWKSHFEWLRKQPRQRGAGLLAGFEEDRKQLRAREKNLEEQD